jgi:hypothetical protein
VTKQTPNPELFLVYVDPKDKSEVSRRHAAAGSLEELDENNLLLHVKTKAASPETQWRELTNLAGSLATVQPVLIDEKGQTLYPTGDLTVRFPKKPTAKQLKDFAAKYGLQLRDRNEFVPEQAAFKLKNPTTTYLPDVLQQIDSDKDIQTAWPNTRSRYERRS